MGKQKNNEVLKYNELAFAGAGDYLIPLFKLQPVEKKRLNKYGRMRRAFLQEQKPIMIDDLVLMEQLFPHLYEVQEIAEKRVEVIMTGLLEKNPAPDKEADAMDWVRHMNMLKAMAEEVVVREVNYT
ncbi:MAG: TnpV protein [Erysipelotrichaceae bacterium]|nr:TnpV protein [Erysipelotrichaceae bacterium]